MDSDQGPEKSAPATGGAMDRERGEASDPRLYASSTEGNRDAILDVLREEFPAAGRVLEVGSGTGQHVVHFSNQLPDLAWQPTDADSEVLASIAAWRDHAAEAPSAIADPHTLDLLGASLDELPTYDALLCINVLHIAPWSVAKRLFPFSVRRLNNRGAPLVLYGPYLKADGTDAPSNLEFDARLKARNAAFGVRKLSAVIELAEEAGFETARIRPMPNNNHALVFRKRA